MRLFVPIDGSGSARAALAHALRIAAHLAGSTIVLANVQNRRTLGLSDISAAEGDEREPAERSSEEIFGPAADSCRAQAVQCETRAGFGPVAETIARLAREAHADQIVMGTRGLGPMRGLVLGSVASRVVQLATVPVTLVKGQGGPAQGPGETIKG
jgi:nucleotide-binding universal stress UspA family protein